MKTDRRRFLTMTSAAMAAPMLGGRAIAQAGGAVLPIPEILEPAATGTVLEAVAGRAVITGSGETRTFGFSQNHMGPVLRLSRGQAYEITLKNRLPFPVTSHWHGAHIDGIHDGGPQNAIAEGEERTVTLNLDQPAATLWYHSHTHGITAEQVYGGLSGLMILDDPAAKEPLPTRYGVDDIPLMLQDRVFAEDGTLIYSKGGMFTMHGFRGDQIMVNGAIRPRTNVPAGLVRLRLLNSSNSRLYDLRFSDGRDFYQIASDGGLMPAPYARKRYYLLPGERIEMLVDFSDGQAVSLLSAPDPTAPGMMGGTPPPQSEIGAGGEFDIVHFWPDDSIQGNGLSLPESFASAPRQPGNEHARTRDITLDMSARDGGMGINGRRFDMGRTAFGMVAGEPELWHVTAPMMVHPFHVHGCSFRVLSRNGEAVPYDLSGMKDVALINGSAELLVTVNNIANAAHPFMMHCHVLEHEDAGMMGQFTVT